LLALALGSSLSITAQQAPPPFTRQTWTIKGVERSAIVVPPRATASKAPAPLVLIFHGHGGTSMHSFRTF
jgi:poly(3-hydroxybutyrate) depolymerase